MSGNFKSAIRINDSRRLELLERLDRTGIPSREGQPQMNKQDKREDKRWEFRMSDVAVTVEHPAGGVSRLLVATRNLSAGGLSFLHGGFLYKGSRALVSLPKVDGGNQTLAGQVMSCRHVDGLVHEVGIKFDRRIEPQTFKVTDSRGSAQDGASLALPDLRGRVLFVDDNEADRKLFEHYVRATGVTLTSVATIDEALAAVKAGPFDFMLTEITVGKGNGIELCQKLRADGVMMPIVIVTADLNPERLAEARKAGGTHSLAKPYKPQHLLALLIELHTQVGAIVPSNGIYSDFEARPGMEAMIPLYIERARQMARQIERGITGKNIEAVRDGCMQIRGTAEGFGFLKLSEASKEALRSLDAGNSLADAATALRKLTLLCDSVAVRPAAAKAAAESPAGAASTQASASATPSSRPEPSATPSAPDARSAAPQAKKPQPPKH